MFSYHLHVFLCIISDASTVQNVSKVSKLWFVHLCHPLQSTFSTNRQDYLTDQYVLLISRCDQMIHWCQAGNENLKVLHNVEHLTPNLPCGKLHVTKRMAGYIFQRIITVGKAFYINMTFLRFEILDSGRRCSDSSFKMLHFTPGHQRAYWIYCGYKPPWSETIQSHKLLIHLNQVEFRNLFNISFMYYVIEHKKFNDYTRKQIYNTKQGIHSLSFTMQEYKKDRTSWLINFPPGCIIHIKELSICCLVAELRIFDGPKKLFELDTLLKNTKHKVIKRLNLYSSYFEILIELYVWKFYDDVLLVHEIIKLNYDGEMAPNKRLLLNSKTTVKSNHKILHLVFLLQGEHMQYPNVTFNVRAFEGWNDGGCNLGGFAVVQHQFNINKSMISGPYCGGGTVNQPLVTKHGLRYLIFGGNRTHLVVFAYGPEYHIDIDVKVSASKCEGLLDPALACPIELPIGEREHVVIQYATSTYKFLCSFGPHYFTSNLYNVVGCVDIQNINHGYAYTYGIQIMVPVVAYLNYNTPTHYAFNGSIALSDYLMVMWGNHSSGVSTVEQTSESKRQHLGKVSTLTVIHTLYREHHLSTLRLKISLFDAPQQTVCRVLNKTLHAEVRLIGYGPAYLAELTDSCVTATYKEATFYIFILLPKPVERNKHITMLCFDIFSVDTAVEMPSILTVTIREILTQSLMVSQGELHIQVVDVSVVMYFEKIDLLSISTFVLEFRRYALPCFALTIGSSYGDLYFQV